jgi:hypothetical protein
MYEKYKERGPVCPCGAHLAVDVDENESTEQ